MKKLLYPFFAVLTSICLVLGGFSFSAQQGRFCAFEVQRAEAAVPLTAPYIFGALLGCFGVSVAGYAAASGEDTATALDNAWASFQSFASSDVVSALTSAFSTVTSPVTPLGALNLSQAVMEAISSWLLQSKYVEDTPAVYPDVVVGDVSIPVVPPPSSPPNPHYFPNFLYQVFNSSSRFAFTDLSPSSVSVSGTTITFRFNAPNAQYVVWDTGGWDVSSTALGRSSYSFSTKLFESNNFTFPGLSAVSLPVAVLLQSSYSFTPAGSGVVSTNAVVSVPSSISSGFTAADAALLAQSVSDAISGKQLDIETATVENPAWSDVVSDIPASLESIQEAVISGFAGVLEGVQTFFRPVVEFFAPLDIRDSDDIGELVISNVSKEHTFTAKFPFCLVNDYKSLYEKAISPVGGSSDYPTPGHFVVKMPSMNGLNSEPITLDMTYIFTNKYMGLTLGQISQLFVAIACLAMFLHWVGDMINVVKSPNYGYVTVEGEAVGRGR